MNKVKAKKVLRKNKQGLSSTLVKNIFVRLMSIDEASCQHFFQSLRKQAPKKVKDSVSLSFYCLFTLTHGERERPFGIQSAAALESDGECILLFGKEREGGRERE